MSDIATGSVFTGRLSIRGISVLLMKLTLAFLLLLGMYEYGLLDFRRILTQPITVRFLSILAAGCGFALGALALLAWRLVLLLSVQGISIPGSRAFLITVVCNLISGLLPGIVAGDVSKAAYLFRVVPRGRGGIAAAVLFDRVIGLYGLLLLGSISAGCAVVGNVAIRSEILWLSIAMTSLATVGLLVLLEFSHRCRIATNCTEGLYFMIGRIVGAVGTYRKQPMTLLAALSLSVASHASTVAMFVCSALAMRDSVPLAGHFVLDPLAMVFNAVPISPGGLGFAEGAFGFLFAGVGSPNGALIGLTGRLLLYSVSALVTLTVLVMRIETGSREVARKPEKLEVMGP
jgi:glycosyltransferase 2 family protein